MNENIIAVSILGTALMLAWLGLDDGGLAKMVVTAFLGWLVGKRSPNKSNLPKYTQPKE